MINTSLFDRPKVLARKSLSSRFALLSVGGDVTLIFR
jgi:hypothetical protein